MRTVIVKVGGSLLTLSDLPERLRTMINVIAADRVMIVAGGGEAADVVRGWDEIHRLDVEVSHWLAIDSMGLTAMLLAGLLPEAVLAKDQKSAGFHTRGGTMVILEPRSILDEMPGETMATLPVGWDCSSDSIAAWIASRWKVDSLVLAKSVDMPMADTNSTKSSGVVDACFNSVVGSDLPVYWCNIQRSPDRVELWKPASR
jgi:5-(aminomethyl)-3-furanmethanol phosphate kinase